jgi:hypothetical protein
MRDAQRLRPLYSESYFLSLISFIKLPNTPYLSNLPVPFCAAYCCVALIFLNRVYKSSGIRHTLIFSVIVVLYAIALPFCYRTAGEPRAAAMLHAQKLGEDSCLCTHSSSALILSLTASLYLSSSVFFSP